MMKRTAALLCASLAPFVFSPAFADDSFNQKKSQVLKQINRRLESIKGKEACVISAENMDELRNCKVRPRDL